MTQSLDSQFFAGNRRRLRELISGAGPIVIAANGVVQRSGDTTFPFRQDSNFYYLAGINEPGLLLVIDGSSEYLIVPRRVASKEKFDGALDFDGLSGQSGIKDILDEKTGWRKLKAGLARDKRMATLLPSPSYIGGHYGFYTNPARAKLIKKIKRMASELEIIDARKTLAGMRVVKQPAEISAIERAIDITNNGIKNVTRNLAGFRYEYEIEASLSASFRASGASGHAFSPIVAAGASACTIHHVENNSPITSSDLVMLDIGAEVNNYAADISRTIIPVRPSERQLVVVNAVQQAQDYIINLIRPGVFMRDLQAESDKFVGQKLIELGLIKRVDDASVRQYYNHAIGHFLGLDTHDVGDYSQPLTENMIVTCEPGIYIADEGIGVRIEDDILLTHDGNRILSR